MGVSRAMCVVKATTFVMSWVPVRTDEIACTDRVTNEHMRPFCKGWRTGVFTGCR